MILPDYVKKSIDILHGKGHEAYAVGGCVRDMLIGKTPSDYDITTSALPEEIKECFVGFRVIETGIKHGTVSVIVDNNILEITTYRIDGKYKDNRRPENVSFSKSLEEDLKRRDFTINAMAYNDENGVKDFFGGKGDISDKIIRCVGDAQTRFEEDALRILRALRFSAVLGFEIEDKTRKAISLKKRLLKNISAERIRDEFSKLIMAKDGAKVLDEFFYVFEIFIPELNKTRGLCQHNNYHIYDVFNHILKSVEMAEDELSVKLCMLFHDIGKPYCFSQDEDGNGHFYGHQRISAAIAKDVLLRLRYPNKMIDTVCTLVNFHDGQMAADEKSVCRWLRRVGEENLRLLLKVKRADALAHEENFAKKRVEEISEIEKVLDEVTKKDRCYSLKQLALSGEDVVLSGISGKEVGDVLDGLLTAVIDGRCENNKEALMEYVKRYTKKRRP